MGRRCCIWSVHGSLGTVVLLEPAHRTQPRLGVAVVGLDVVVGVPIGAMPSRRQQLFQHACIHRRSVSDDLDWRALGRADGSFEEARAALTSRRGATNTSMRVSVMPDAMSGDRDHWRVLTPSRRSSPIWFILWIGSRG